MRYTLALLLACAFAALSPALAGEKRYVVENKVTGGGWPVWTSQLALDSCTKALLRGTKRDQQEFCETGFSGLTPKVGSLLQGTEVELLDARGNCGRMVAVRVLTGPLQGETGCITGTALSSFKP